MRGWREPVCVCGHVLTWHSRRRMICFKVWQCGCTGYVKEAA
jgi:hypothetical protein